MKTDKSWIRKIFSLVFFWFALVFLSLLTTCGCGNYIIMPGKVDIRAGHHNNTEDTARFTNNEQLIFYYSGRSDCRCLASFNYGNIISSAVATSPCDNNLKTQFIPEKTVLTINKPFIFKGDTIEANANLTTHPVVKEYLVMPYEIYSATNKIHFTGDFYFDSTNLTFPAGEYIFSFKWESMRGGIFEGEETVYIDLQY